MHPLRLKILQLEEELATSKLELYRLENAVELPKAERSYRVFAAKGSFSSGPSKEKLPLRIVGTLENGDVYDSHLEMWGFIPNPPALEIRSVTYYLSILGEKGVVLFTSGGWHVLKEDLVVEVEEWRSVRNGTIPLPKEWLRDKM